MDSPSIRIEDSAPLPVRRPASAAELGEFVARARASKQGVFPVGGRTSLDVGLPPSRPGVALDTTGLNGVIDYPARDMTITVRAGITIAEVQRVLGQEGQWLPLDVAAEEKATLGGAIALNQSGPHRYGCGTLRDYVIGISFVTDDGVEVKAGGRVVKNVAGYDLMKLQIGALGTLGVVTQATLKVKPRPEKSEVVAFGCAEDALEDVLNRLHRSRTRPVAVELFSRDAWKLVSPAEQFPECRWVIAVGFEEKETTVRWQVSTLLDEIKGIARGESTLAGSAALWSAVAALQTHPESRFISKISVRPSQLAQTAQALASQKPEAILHAHALNGVVWFHDRVEHQGNSQIVIRRCPPERKKSLPIWGQPRPDWGLMRHIKRTLDPDDVFNPGRLFGA